MDNRHGCPRTACAVVRLVSRRIRTIKAEVLLFEPAAAALSDAAWRLWTSVRMLADDFGTFRADPKYLAAQIWADTFRSKKIAKYLSELVAAGRVAIFTHENQPYGVLVRWDDEQRVDNRSDHTRLPIPPEEIQALSSKVAAYPITSLGHVGKEAVHVRAHSSGRIRIRSTESESEGDPERAGACATPPIDFLYSLAKAFADGISDANVGIDLPPMPSDGDRATLKRIVDSYAGRSGVSLAESEKLTTWLRGAVRAFAASTDDFTRTKRGLTVRAFHDSLSRGPPARPTLQPKVANAKPWGSPDKVIGGDRE